MESSTSTTRDGALRPIQLNTGTGSPGNHVFIGKIGEPGPEPDTCTDIIETAQRASPSPVQPMAKHVFVGVIHGAEYEDGSASDGETIICSDDESSIGEIESLY